MGSRIRYRKIHDLVIGDPISDTTGVLKVAGTTISTLAAEYVYLDVVPGTGAASKAMVLDSGEDYVLPASGKLTYGGAAINASGLEITQECDASVRIVANDAALSITSAHNAKIIYHSNAVGKAITLPAASGSGNIYTVVVGTTVTSVGITIKAASASDSFLGGVTAVDDDSDGTAFCWKAEANDDTITMDGSTNGGIAGDWIKISDVASGLFLIEGFIQNGASEATPFSASVS